MLRRNIEQRPLANVNKLKAMPRAMFVMCSITTCYFQWRCRGGQGGSCLPNPLHTRCSDSCKSGEKFKGVGVMISSVSQGQSVLCMHTKKRKMCKYIKILCLLSQHIASAFGLRLQTTTRTLPLDPAGGLLSPRRPLPQPPTAGDATGHFYMWRYDRCQCDENNKFCTLYIDTGHRDSYLAIWLQ